tara:strand:- start:357 stop:866 length:510 start_codon:yes stop_codon:yes gene_type:complete
MRESKTSDNFSKIDATTTLIGTIKTQDDVRIDGVLEGDVETSGKLIIGKEARVKGKILCKNAEIEGVLKGELRASGTLSLRAGCQIKGKIIIQKLIVDSGAILNASCTMYSKENENKKIGPKTTISEDTEEIGAWNKSIEVDDPGILKMNSIKNKKEAKKLKIKRTTIR